MCIFFVGLKTSVRSRFGKIQLEYLCFIWLIKCFLWNHGDGSHLLNSSFSSLQQRVFLIWPSFCHPVLNAFGRTTYYVRKDVVASQWVEGQLPMVWNTGSNPTNTSRFVNATITMTCEYITWTKKYDISHPNNLQRPTIYISDGYVQVLAG